MKRNNALVITWIGDHASDDVVKAIANVLINSVTIPEMLTITQKDEDAIATALLRTNNNVGVEAQPEDARTSSVILIGKRFENTLRSTNGNYVPFTMALLKALSDAKKYHTEEDISLIAAVEILATVKKLPKIARMYNVTDEVINVIRQVYNTTSPWIS